MMPRGLLPVLFVALVFLATGCGEDEGGSKKTSQSTADSVTGFLVGGTIGGISGTVVLQNNGGDDLSLTGDGAFTFSTLVENGVDYEVTVSSKPSGLVCTVNDGSGTVADADVDTVTVTCSTQSYSIAGTLTGLLGTLTLRNNGGDDLTLTADGDFAFSTNQANGSDYDVTVFSKPVNQNCQIGNGKGTLEGGNANVTVTCSIFALNANIQTPTGDQIILPGASLDFAGSVFGGILPHGFDWNFDTNSIGGGPSSSTQQVPGSVSFGVEGYFKTTYTVTDFKGDSFSASVFVNVRPPLKFVDAGATGANDGSTWANAYTSIQAAVDAASTGNHVWVKVGNYVESSTASVVVMKAGVNIFGGFAGTEIYRSQRPTPLLISALNGNTNSYHVVVGASNARLDGFTITGGNANGGGADNNGGGISNNATSGLVLTNLIVNSNSATSGGGMYNTSSAPTLSKVTFSSNSATAGGGMFNSASSNPTLSNVTFSANTTTSDGGGMFNTSSSPILTDVTFSANTANAAGGGMYNQISASPKLTNVTFSGNSSSANNGGGMANYTSSAPVLTNVTFSTNTASANGGGMYNTGASNAVVTNGVFWGNSGTSVDVANSTSTPVITYTCSAQAIAGTGNVTLGGNPLVAGSNGELFINQGSACVNAGSDAAANDATYGFQALGLTDWTGLTTSSAGNLDVTPVDMGRHY